jgi:hypothetical protein
MMVKEKAAHESIVKAKESRNEEYDKGLKLKNTIAELKADLERIQDVKEEIIEIKKRENIGAQLIFICLYYVYRYLDENCYKFP